MAHRSGDTTEGVVLITSYLTVQQFNVILQGSTHVVIIGRKDGAVTQQNTAIVNIV